MTSKFTVGKWEMREGNDGSVAVSYNGNHLGTFDDHGFVSFYTRYSKETSVDSLWSTIRFKVNHNDES